VLLAAIGAVASTRPQEAESVLADLQESDDGEIAGAVGEALSIARGDADDEDWEDDDDALGGGPDGNDKLLH